MSDAANLSRLATVVAVSLLFALLVALPPRVAGAVAPDGEVLNGPPVPKVPKRPNFGVGQSKIGLLQRPNGQWHLRQPVSHDLAATPGQRGAGLAAACIAWVSQEPTAFANLAASSLRLRRLHPVPLRPQGSAEPGTLWSVEFEQLHGGRPVEDAVLQFHVEDRTSLPWCRVRVVLGRFFPSLAPLPESELSEAECRDAAARAIGLPATGLMITDEFHSVRVERGAPQPVMHVVCGFQELDLVVNEVTGKVTAKSTCHHDTMSVTATVELDNHDPASLTTDVGMPNVEIDCGGDGTFYTDENGNATVPNGATGTLQLIGKHSHIVRRDAGPEQSDTLTGDDTATFSDTSEFTLAENDAYYHTDLVWTWLSTRIDTDVADSFFDTFALETQVNFNDTGNADFSSGGGTLNGGTTPRMRFFRAGGAFNNTAMSDVVYHEYGHYADWAMGGIFSNGGLSEGWGDIVAAYITGDSVLGEYFRTDGSGLRDCDNNYQWDENDEIHTAGTAWSGFAWRIREAFIAEYGAVAGAAKAEALIFGALDANTTSVPDSITWVDIYDLLNGGNETTQAIIDAAAAAQGLDDYTAPPFRITGMTSDVGFMWEGSTTPVHIDVTVQNTDGSNHAITVALTGADVSFSDKTTGSLDPGESDTLTFTWDARNADEGDYTLVATATVSGFGEDDTAQVLVTVAPANGSSVFFDDFESGLSQWDTVTGDWGIEDDSDLARSGTHSATESPGDDYSPNSNTMMISAPFSLEDVTGTRVSLFHVHTIEDDWDYGTIEMSSEGGEFTTVGIVTGIAELHHETFDASALDGRTNVRLRLRFWTDPGTDLAGWNVDDIRVFGATSPGATAPDTTALATDGFETNNFTGGSGWNGNWTTSGNADIRTTGPAAGTYHARLRGASGAGSRGSIERFCDISAAVSPRVSVLLWTGGTLPNGFFPGDSLHVELSDDGGSNWTPWFTFYNAHNSAAYDYHLFDVAVADLGLSKTATFGIRIRADNLDDTAKSVFVDAVTVYGSNSAPVFDSIDDLEVEVDSELTFTVSATDPDDDIVTLSATLLPDGATFNPTTGEFAWTPDADDVDQQFTASFEATDGINSPSEMDVLIDVVAKGSGKKKKSSGGGCVAGGNGSTSSLDCWRLCLLLILVLVAIRRRITC